MYHQQPPMMSYAPPERVYLDDYNSDLHLDIERDGFTAKDLHDRGFEYIWAGVRATHGVTRGKVFFEVHVLENLRVHMPDTESTPNVCRVGWSVDSLEIALGETQLSYGYGGTGKASTNSKFFDYGERYTAGDVITCYLDLEATPKAIFFAKNGQYLGVAFRLGREVDGKVLFPHVYVKNMRFRVNFGQERSMFPPAPEFLLLADTLPGTLARGPRGPTHREECEALMMVGLPGVGKTVWCTKYAQEHPEKKYNILGTNTIIDKMKVMGLSRKRNYHGRWDQLIKQATDILNQTFKIAERKNRNYILDQTNVYPNARRRKMNNFRGYHRIAVVLVTTNDVLKERTTKREKEEGKMVPEQAVMEMKANFTLPEIGELFNDVWFVEEDSERSKKLIVEIQIEGKNFKEAEKKRPAESSSAPEQRDVTKKPHLGAENKDTSYNTDVKPRRISYAAGNEPSAPYVPPSRHEPPTHHEPPARHVPPARSHNQRDFGGDSQRNSSNYLLGKHNEKRPGDFPSTHSSPSGSVPYNGRPYGGGYASTHTTDDRAPSEVRIKQEPGTFNSPPVPYNGRPYGGGYAGTHTTDDRAPSEVRIKQEPGTFNSPPPSLYSSNNSSNCYGSGYNSGNYSNSQGSSNYYPSSSYDYSHGSDLSQSSGYSSGYGSQDSAYSYDTYGGYGSQSYQYSSQDQSYDKKPYQQYDMPAKAYPPVPPQGDQGAYHQGRYENWNRR